MMDVLDLNSFYFLRIGIEIIVDCSVAHILSGLLDDVSDSQRILHRGMNLTLAISQ